MKSWVQTLRVLVSASLALAVGGVSAQSDYPSKPIRVVVPFPAGGSVDPPVRLVAEQMAKLSGATFVIENRAGAGGLLAIKGVIGSPADGYTLLVSGATLAIGAALYNPKQFDPATQLTHIARVAVAPSAIVVPGSSPYKSLRDLVDAARAKPGEITYGTPGIGSPTHIFMEALSRRANIKLVHVPYRGAAPALTDVSGAHVDLIAVSLSSAAVSARAGKVRVLAVTSPKRQPDYAQVQAVSEVFDGLEDQSWIQFAAPAGLNPAIADKLAGWVKAALADPATHRALTESGQIPAYLGPAETAALVNEKTLAYGRVIQESNVKPE